MLRSFLIRTSKALWLRQIVTGWFVTRKMAARFVAGESLGDAIQVIKFLNSMGINATVDHLGERINSPQASRKATQEILAVLDALREWELRANVSVKLTQIGLLVDVELCAENLRTILTYGRECGNFVRIDMEDSAVTQMTLDLFYQMRAEDFTNVGIVIQSYLYRSEKDISRLAEAALPVRLCKGAYKEPHELAYPRKRDVDAAYDRQAGILLQAAGATRVPGISADGKFPPLAALATHDEKRIQFALDYSTAASIPKSNLEFQMLHGIRRDLQEKLAQKGYPVRVYVPYGTEWYPYFMRRLAERPANLWFFLQNYFRK